MARRLCGGGHRAVSRDLGVESVAAASVAGATGDADESGGARRSRSKECRDLESRLESIMGAHASIGLKRSSRQRKEGFVVAEPPPPRYRRHFLILPLGRSIADEACYLWLDRYRAGMD